MTARWPWVRTILRPMRRTIRNITVMNAALRIARACRNGDLTPPECEAAREVAKILKLDLAAHGF